MGFRLRASALRVLGLAWLAAGCGEDGKSITIRTRVLAPSDRAADPFAGAASVRVSVVQDGAVAGSADFSLDEEWSIPDADVDIARPLQVRISGLDAQGAVVLDGRSRPIVPRDAEGTFGVFVSPAGAFALPPAAMSVPRREASVLVLDDARVLVIGGETEADEALDSIEMYDPDSGTWTTLASMSIARTAPALAQLLDGRVLVAGGDSAAGEDLATCEILTLPSADDADGTIAPCADMQTPARAMGAARLPSGRILLAGGESDLGPPRPTIYDPAGDAWTVPATGNRAASAHVASFSDGRVAIVGGADAGGALDRIDVVTESGADVTVTSASMRVPRIGASALVVNADGQEQLLVTGGMPDDTGRPTAAVELVSFASTPVSTFLERDLRHRVHRGIARLQGGLVLLAGGQFGVSSNVAEIFDPVTKRIEESVDLGVARRARRTTVSLSDGTAMIAGGDDATAVEIYQPPAAPLAGATRVDFSISPQFAARAGGADPMEGGSTFRLRVLDPWSIVDERIYPATSATLSLPFKVGIGADDDVYVTLELLDGSGTILAWGATASRLGAAAQAAGIATIQLGRANEFTVAGTMASARGSAAAAVLTDGRVAVAGGMTAPTSTEIFDPLTGTVVAGPVIPSGGHWDDFGSAVVGTNLFLVGGRTTGSGSSVTTATNVLNLATATWRTPAPAPIPTPSRRHSLNVLANGDLFLYGGADGSAIPISTAARRAANGTWSPVPVATPDRRNEHDAVTLSDGRVLISGGITSNGTIALSGTAVVWDAANGFASTGSLVQPRRNHCTAPLPGGGAVVCGGHATVNAGAMRDTCEVWNGTTWSLLTDTLSVPRSEMARTILADGRVMMIGGGTQNGAAQESTIAVDLLDLGNLGVTAGPSLVEAREEAVAVTLPDGRVVVFGGQDDTLGIVRDSIEIYTPPSWRNPFGY